VGLAGLTTLAIVATTPRAQADLVVLTTGRVIPVRAYTVDGTDVRLELRAGGEIRCAASLIARVDPDEVPWPDPAEAATGQAPPPAEAAQGTGPYDELIEPLSRQHGVESALVRAVVATESAFERTARSPKGAMGLMQLMPITARQYDVRDPYDPGANLEAGIRHLKSLLDRYDMRIALAAYNAGEATVRRHGGIPPFRETREYIDRVLRRLREYRRAGVGTPAAADTRPAFASPTS
jgi:hypothetical protein